MSHCCLSLVLHHCSYPGPFSKNKSGNEKTRSMFPELKIPWFPALFPTPTCLLAASPLFPVLSGKQVQGSSLVPGGHLSSLASTCSRWGRRAAGDHRDELCPKAEISPWIRVLRWVLPSLEKLSSCSALHPLLCFVRVTHSWQCPGCPEANEQS